jgi:TPR repeat protein
MEYFKKSAAVGNSNGINNYGLGLEKGFLGKIDLKEAMKYYKMAADLGNQLR